jgi:hypothetical protein
MLTPQPGEEASVRGIVVGQGRPVEGKEGQRSKPPSTGCAVCSASDPSRPWRLVRDGLIDSAPGAGALIVSKKLPGAERSGKGSTSVVEL